MIKWVLLIAGGALAFLIMPKRLNAEGLQLIKDFEGLSLTVYDDAAGLPTIGYGHLIQSGENFETITEAQAEQLLRDDVARFERAVNRSVNVPISQNMFNALVSFSYNVGVGAFERSTLLKFLNRGDYIAASRELDRWTKAGGQHIEGLAIRRQREREVFFA